MKTVLHSISFTAYDASFGFVKAKNRNPITWTATVEYNDECDHYECVLTSDSNRIRTDEDRNKRIIAYDKSEYMMYAIMMRMYFRQHGLRFRHKLFI